MTDVLQAQRCLELAKKLRKTVRPGDTMNPVWDVIFGLEAYGKGKPEDVLLKDIDIIWHIYNAESALRRYV